MCLRCFGQRIGLIDLDFNGTALNNLKEFRGVGDEVGALRGVGEQRRARNVKRAFGAEPANIKILDRSGRIAERYKQSERLQSVE